MNKDILDIQVFDGDDNIKYIKYDDLILCLDRAKETHKELQQRIDKAIEYIKEHYPTATINDQDDKYKLLNILQGSDSNE